MNQDKYIRPKEEVVKEFQTQEKFVFFNMNHIAEGESDFFKLLATNFRILFHHQGANKSLFNQLGIQDIIQMVSTCSEFSSNNLLAFNGLVSVRVGSEIANYIPHDIPSKFRTLNFQKWWEEEIIICDSAREKWTRKRLVIHAADKDGGSHLDPSLPFDYYKLAYQNSIGLKFFKGKFDSGKDLENPLPAYFWQIGREFLKSMEIFRKSNNF